MKSLKLILVTSMITLLTGATDKPCEIVDEYSFKMTLKIPRIYDNMQSLGSRKYQKQLIKGTLLVRYIDGEIRPQFQIVDLVNRTHKINGKNITYDVIVDDEGNHVYPRLNYVGDNKTGVFKKASIVFYFDAIPSYNIGEDEPDNTLLVTLSGTGSAMKKKKYGCQIITSFSGTVSGTLGCGCTAYGHKSPTRIAGPYGPTDYVDDVASVDGSWRAVFKTRHFCY